MRLIDGDALKEAFYQKMKELLKSTDTPQISNEALSLLCGASLITEAPTIEPDIECINKFLKTCARTYTLSAYLKEGLAKVPSEQPDIAEKLYQYKCYITDKEGLQHEVIHTGDIRRVTGWEI